MRPSRSLECTLAAFVSLNASLALAEPAPQAAATATPAASESHSAESAAVLAARRHFENGVRLYQDANYSAALIEFEAANELKPGSASLQNIALCQKALFRYAAAAATL